MSQYDNIAKVYNEGDRMEHPVELISYRRWLEECGNLNGLRVLDLACGGGNTSRLLRNNGAIVVGVDEAFSMLEIARRKEKEYPLGIEYIQENVICLRNFQDIFDLITFGHLLHYAKSKKQLRKMVEKIFCNLKPGGRIVGINCDSNHPVTTKEIPNIFHRTSWLDKPWLEGSRLKVEMLCPGNPSFKVSWWKEKTYNEILRAAGFESIVWKPILFEENEKVENWAEIEEDIAIKLITARKPN